jgi:hypothetical protein
VIIVAPKSIVLVMECMKGRWAPIGAQPALNGYPFNDGCPPKKFSLFDSLNFNNGFEESNEFCIEAS